MPDQPTPPNPHVRIAQLQVDGTQLDAFTAAARALGQAAMHSEPGCLALYAVADQDDPTRITVFEMYRDEAAYQTHVQSAHFAAFRAATQTMVQSRQLKVVQPLSLADRTLPSP